jgi:hypothetical protein
MEAAGIAARLGMAALAAMLWAVCGSAHADWAVRGDETGVTLIGAVSDDAASGEPNGAHFEATCIKGSVGAEPLSFAFTHTPAAAKIKIADKVPGDEVARVSSGPTKMTTAAGTLRYTFIWSVRLMSMIANARKEIKMVFDGDPTPIAVPARGSGEAVRQDCKYDLKQSPSSPAESSA